MKIGRRFNQLSVDEYYFYIDNHKKCEDFNTLGLYRSIIENEKLSVEDKIRVRDYAHRTFIKAFNFLQLKDPDIFVAVSTLGEVITKGDEEKIWNDIRKNQQQILADKRIKHRNFGVYAKHTCSHANCLWHGVMVRQGSTFSYLAMHFESDKSKWSAELKSERNRLDRKRKAQLIKQELDNG